MSERYYHEEMREWKTLDEWRQAFEDFGETTGYGSFEDFKSNHLTSEEDYHSVERVEEKEE